MRALVTFAMLLAACSAPPSGLGPGTVLTYGVGHRDGEASLRVHEDGTAEYKSTFGPKPVDVKAKVTPDELKSVLSVLRDNGFCGMRSHRSTGVPDEARPSISVRAPGEGLDCRVELWDGEFRDNPRAQKCLRAVEALGSKLEDRTPR